MHLSPAESRSTRIRRVLAITAAAAAVMVGPTACNYGVTSGLHGTGSSSSGGVSGGDQDSDPTVVPVANTKDTKHGRHYGQGGTTTTAIPVADTSTVPATDTATAAPLDPVTAAPTDSVTAAPTAAPTGPVAPGTPASANPNVGAPLPDGGNAPSLGKGPNNGLSILGRDCTKSKLPLHDGLQNDPAGQGACINTEMGELAAKDKLPSLLITDAPRVVGMNQAFTLKVSTRNLVRDRFLGAKAGGYYLESSFLSDDPAHPERKGLQRGHFHTACRILPSVTEAPDSSVDPNFFLATEDGGGGTTPDTVTIPVPAIGKPGILQCTSWAGDGSHRTPMMTQANETPAIDSVKIFVTPGNQPVRYDVAAANAAIARINGAHAAQAGPQDPDLTLSKAPTAPNPAAAPATAAPAVGDNAAAPAVGSTPGGSPAPADPAKPAKPATGSTGTSSTPSTGAAKPGN